MNVFKRLVYFPMNGMVFVVPKKSCPVHQTLTLSKMDGLKDGISMVENAKNLCGTPNWLGLQMFLHPNHSVSLIV
uniref:Uncharacterized protein n=1 Tax=Acrobeloides nanus TaxID=290746 RepID=A0A914E203_9BILA